MDFVLGNLPEYRGKLYFHDSSQCEILGNIVCLTAIPSFMIPADILLYFKSVIASIRAFHVAKVNSNTLDGSTFIGIIILESESAAKDLILNFNTRPISTTLEPTTCDLRFVREIRITIGAIDSNIEKKLQKLSFVQGNIRYEHADAIIYESSIWESLLVKDCAINDTSQCPVCLDNLHQPPNSPTFNKSPILGQGSCVLNTFTMYCSHELHISCAIKLQSSDCPVCRYNHESNSSNGHQRRDNMHDMCMICSTMTGSSSNPLVSNYATKPSENIERGTVSVLHDTNQLLMDSLWYCLVCGFIGCGMYSHNHILQHYQQTQHTYALNLREKHVWDFAGME